MEHLSQADVRCLFDRVAELYALGDVASFTGRLTRAVGGVVPGEVVGYFEIDSRTPSITWSPRPGGPAFDVRDGERVFARHLHDLPLLGSYRRGAGSAVKITDFVTQRQFRRTPLYCEFYRPAGVEYHICKGLPGPAGLVTGVAVARALTDFSERDRLVLNLLRPHLNQAYLNARSFDETRSAVELAERGLDALDRGVVAVGTTDRITFITTRARQWLAAYFGETVRDRLPATLREWLERQMAGGDGRAGLPTVRLPFTAAAEGRRLAIRLLVEANRRILILSEERTAPIRTAVLACLGLTHREAEVLAWVAEGKTSAEIASILGASPRTIAKHLENIFRKLGVETRTAAAARALEVAAV